MIPITYITSLWHRISRYISSRPVFGAIWVAPTRESCRSASSRLARKSWSWIQVDLNSGRKKQRCLELLVSQWNLFFESGLAISGPNGRDESRTCIVFLYGRHWKTIKANQIWDPPTLDWSGCLLLLQSFPLSFQFLAQRFSGGCKDAWQIDVQKEKKNGYESL